MDDLNWDDYFSSHRESGGEERIDDIMARLEAGESLSSNDFEFLKAELEGRHEYAKGSQVFRNKEKRGF